MSRLLVLSIMIEFMLEDFIIKVLLHCLKT